MNMPSAQTIRSNIDVYAAKVGLTIVRNSNGSYTIHDNVVGYDPFTNVDMDWVVRTVEDSLYMELAASGRIGRSPV